jgi:hypothetical protein
MATWVLVLSSPDSVLHVSDTSQPKITIEDSTNNSFGRITGGGSTGSLTFEADFDNTKAGTVMAFNVDNMLTMEQGTMHAFISNAQEATVVG